MRSLPETFGVLAPGLWLLRWQSLARKRCGRPASYDLTGNPYGYARIELGGLLIGAILFGVGMSLVGTCGFGVSCGQGPETSEL